MDENQSHLLYCRKRAIEGLYFQNYSNFFLINLSPKLLNYTHKGIDLKYFVTVVQGINVLKTNDYEKSMMHIRNC